MSQTHFSTHTTHTLTHGLIFSSKRPLFYLHLPANLTIIKGKQQPTASLNPSVCKTLLHYRMPHRNLQQTFSSETILLKQQFWFLNFFFFFFFCLFGAAAYGGSQARGPIGAVAASLHHSHSNSGSKHCLQPAPQLTATPTERGQGSNSQPHGS